MTERDTRLMLIDGHALVHRAFHALPELTTSGGELVNAVFGFASMLLKAIATVQPTHIIMAMDRPTPTFRHESYAEYKAQRPPTPRPLVSQFHRVREIAEAMNIAIYEMDGYEADDILGTLSSQAEKEGLETIILTGDLDTLQLVDEHVRILTLKRGIADTTLYDAGAVHDRYGLSPEQMPEFKGLVGDTSDNIPGVRGIGDKTASKLLAQYGTVEGIFDHLDQVPERVRKALEEHKDQVFRSRELATIVRDAPVELSLEHAAFTDIDRTRLVRLFSDLEFQSLIERVQSIVPAGETSHAAAALAPAPVGAPFSGREEQLSLFAGTEAAQEAADSSTSAAPLATPLGLFPEVTGAAPDTRTRTVLSMDDLHALVAELRDAGTFSVDTETTSTDPLRARLVGLSFATRPGHAWYLPVGHLVDGDAAESVRTGQLPLHTVLETLRPVLEDPSAAKIGHNLKYDHTVLAMHGIEMVGLAFDTMIAAYLVNPTGRGLSLSALALSRLGIEMTPIESLIGKGKSQITMDRVPIDTVAAYAGADAEVTLRLRDTLQPELASRELEALFHDIEMPLVTVLSEMERIGVTLDTRVLDEMSAEMSQLIGELEGGIYERAGHRFNINSTQQLAQVLFQELKLPAGRRTKTGHSTDNEVLEGLRDRHPIVNEILEYRQLVKLKNTYIDALPSLINPDTGRVHTDFNQTIAATGRLSSSNPNLQNIPIRGELGRKIRRAFIPSAPNHVLLAADYSQIELRILAAVSGDERLVRAFSTGEDIHRATASAVFGVPADEVTADQRRIAKVVNFGIIYGIGEQRLAHETGISRQEAGEFIASYNTTYAGVKAYMDQMRKRAAAFGYVSTMVGRRRYIPDIHSDHPGVRQAAERAAINMPIQGTAADIIKIAMIRLQQLLHERYPESEMVLQVHDELVFDVPRDDVSEVSKLVADVMEHAMELSVPLEVELKVGEDWYDMSPLHRSAA